MNASYDYSAPTAVSITSVDNGLDDQPASIVNLITVAADHASAVEVLAQFATDQGVMPSENGLGGYYLIDADGERNSYLGEHAREDALRDALGAAGYTVAMSIGPAA